MDTATQIPMGSRAGLTRPPRVPVLVAIVVVATGLAAVSAWLATDDGVPELEVALLQWISIPYVAAGVIAWWRRPESLLGPLMIGGGFATSLLGLQFAGSAAVQTFGALLDIVPAAILLHVSLAFPSGRLRSNAERTLVAAAYAAAIGLQIAKMMLGAFGPDNLLVVASPSDATVVVERLQLFALSAFCLTGVALLVRRRRVAGRRALRWPAVLVDLFAGGLVMIAVLYIDAAFVGPAFKEIQHLTLAVVGLAPLAFLIGLLDARLARSSVGDLVIRLRANPAPAEVEAALARALRDPTLSLAYWLPEFDGYADVDGREMRLPEPGGGRAVTPVDHDGARVAALIHDPSLSDEPELLEAVSAAAGIALENARLQVELRARLEELRGSRARIVEVAQQERKRLERNLHDGAQQRLVALSLELGLLGEHLDADGAARERLDQARGEIARSLAELREIARGLHPAVVSAHGLGVALEQLVALAPVPVTLVVRVEERLPEALEVAAYYIVSESLANVGKYAHADSARVEVLRQADLVLVEVVGRRRRRRRHRAGLGAARAGRPGRGARRTAAGLEPPRGRHAGERGDPVRVVIAEDSVLLREGVARILTDAGLDVVGLCEDADELLLKVRSYSPDVCVVDIRMPPTHTDEGLRAAIQIRESHPGVGVLVLSQYVELGLALKLLADSAEGVGYLLKDRISDVGEFVDAVRRVASGGSAIDPIIVSTLLGRRRADDPIAELTPREREVLDPDGRGALQPGDRRPHGDHAARRREVRVDDLHQARPALDRQRLPPRPRGAALPEELTARGSAPDPPGRPGSAGDGVVGPHHPARVVPGADGQEPRVGVLVEGRHRGRRALGEVEVGAVAPPGGEGRHHLVGVRGHGAPHPLVHRDADGEEDELRIQPVERAGVLRRAAERAAELAELEGEER